MRGIYAVWRRVKLIDAGLTDDIIRDQMLTMLIAGHDTSTALLAWTFALIGQHPEFHARLVDEVNTQEKSALLDQVIKECLRLYPPIHIGNRRVAKEMEFTEGIILANERMFYSIYLTHRDPEIWENAEDFSPERFAHGRKTPPYSYIPLWRRSARLHWCGIWSGRDSHRHGTAITDT